MLRPRLWSTPTARERTCLGRTSRQTTCKSSGCSVNFLKENLPNQGCCGKINGLCIGRRPNEFLWNHRKMWPCFRCVTCDGDKWMRKDSCYRDAQASKNAKKEGCCGMYIWSRHNFNESINALKIHWWWYFMGEICYQLICCINYYTSLMVILVYVWKQS